MQIAQRIGDTETQRKNNSIFFSVSLPLHVFAQFRAASPWRKAKELSSVIVEDFALDWFRWRQSADGLDGEEAGAGGAAAGEVVAVGAVEDLVLVAVEGGVGLVIVAEQGVEAGAGGEVGVEVGVAGEVLI